MVDGLTPVEWRQRPRWERSLRLLAAGGVGKVARRVASLLDEYDLLRAERAAVLTALHAGDDEDPVAAAERVRRRLAATERDRDHLRHLVHSLLGRGPDDTDDLGRP